MTLHLPDRWVWDSWFAFDGHKHHAFYLSASRALHDPERRHRHPIIGHAVSENLRDWDVVEDALIISDGKAFDSWTTWTGSVVRDDSGLWWMFYTGTSREEGLVQRIGAATSPDLLNWTKLGSEALLEADPTWYERLSEDIWHDEAWRDPFVFRDTHDANLWHMLITARAKEGEAFERGVVGHATSRTLTDWQIQPPLSSANTGFGQLEVLQYEVVDGVPIVIFSCGPNELSSERQAQHGNKAALFSIPCDNIFENIPVEKAQLFEVSDLYSWRLVNDATLGWCVIAFTFVNGAFEGDLCDPIPVTASPELGLIRK
jgi:beta-fructofuranosidase